MMDSTVFDQPYFQNVVNALCWTLIHSLWQGLVLAILTGIVLLLSRKSAPGLRYNVFSGMLLLFMLVNAATFFYVFEQSEISGARVNVPPDDIALTSVVHTSNRIIPSGFGYSFIENLTSVLNRNAAPIVICWLIVFLIKSVNTTAGAFYNERLRRMETYPVSESWNWQLRQLAVRLEIYGRVILMESGIVTVPVTLGFLKPVIIVPLGFLTSLPQQQVEAILLHELAHIKRKDYLVNFLQCVAENVYFFNPAFLWVSFLIKAEREHCCDDLVIGVTSDQMSFVNALVSFKEAEIAVNNTGMSFAGNRNHLLNRIKRIIFNDNKQLTTMEKFSISTSLIAVTFLSMAYFSPLQPEQTLKQVVPKIEMRPMAEKVSVVKEDRVVKAKPVKRLAKSNAPAPVDSLANIDQLMSDLKKAVESKDLQVAKTVKDQLLTLIWKEREQVKAQTIEAKLRSEAFIIQKGQTAVGNALGNLQEAMLKTESEKLQARSAQINAIHEEYEKINRDFWKEQLEINAAEDKAMQEELIQDLISENVIKDRENLSFKLHNMFLIVNGVEQPESLHQKLKAKYLKRTWTEWVYNWDGATGHRFTGVRYNG